MSKNSKILKDILNSKDIIYPHELYRGLCLTEDDFICLEDLFEKCRRENLEKYLRIRNIGNSIIAKDSFLQGIAYREINGPELKLLFKNEYPLDWNRYHELEQEIKKMEKMKKSIKDAKMRHAIDERNEMNVKLVAFNEKNKDILSQINSFNIDDLVYIKDGEISSKEDYDSTFPAYTINEDVLYYLLNAVNLGSSLDIAIAREYFEELTAFQESLDAGLFYKDFSTVDYTGTLHIETIHDYYTALKPNNCIQPTPNFGKVIVDFDQDFTLHCFNICYTCYNGSCYIQTDLSNKEKILERGFVHKALLPERYQQKKK